MNCLIEVNNLSYVVSAKAGFGLPAQKVILDNVSFSLQPEKILGIAGESGSGKTTLAKLISGILLPTSGNISLNFAGDWKSRKTKPIQILFQNTGEILNPLREVNDIINEAVDANKLYLTRFERESLDSALKTIEGLPMDADQFIDECIRAYSRKVPEFNPKNYEL
jgi:ABC-type dipeptide/oligopeptide/nickel transport system ATPase subunit